MKVIAMSRLATLFWLLLFCTGALRAENWPAWRGADGTGICRERQLPVHWSATTNIHWKIPLPEPCNSTPIVAGDKLYVNNLEGDTFVLRAARKFEVLAKNSIGEPTYAPLAPSSGNLLLRTHQHLYCIDESP
jgi:hypothetical protein